jgi:hypothetical protein
MSFDAFSGLISSEPIHYKKLKSSNGLKLDSIKCWSSLFNDLLMNFSLTLVSIAISDWSISSSVKRCLDDRGRCWVLRTRLFVCLDDFFFGVGFEYFLILVRRPLFAILLSFWLGVSLFLLFFSMFLYICSVILIVFMTGYVIHGCLAMSAILILCAGSYWSIFYMRSLSSSDKC